MTFNVHMFLGNMVMCAGFSFAFFNFLFGALPLYPEVVNEAFHLKMVGIGAVIGLVGVLWLSWLWRQTCD